MTAGWAMPMTGVPAATSAAAIARPKPRLAPVTTAVGKVSDIGYCAGLNRLRRAESVRSESRPAAGKIRRGRADRPGGGSAAVGDRRRQGVNESRLRTRLVQAQPAQQPVAALLLQQREQDVLGADVVVTQPQRPPEGQFEGLLGSRVERDEGGQLGRGRRQAGGGGGP